MISESVSCSIVKVLVPQEWICFKKFDTRKFRRAGKRREHCRQHGSCYCHLPTFNDQIGSGVMWRLYGIHSMRFDSFTIWNSCLFVHHDPGTLYVTTLMQWRRYDCSWLLVLNPNFDRPGFCGFASLCRFVQTSAGENSVHRLLFEHVWACLSSEKYAKISQNDCPLLSLFCCQLLWFRPEWSRPPTTTAAPAVVAKSPPAPPTADGFDNTNASLHL